MPDEEEFHAPATVRRRVACMARRTKVVATIGPASGSPEMLRRLIDAGMDVARVGLAHGSVAHNLETVAAVRRAADAAGVTVGVLADLPGPKLRSAGFVDDGVDLVAGASIDLVADGDRSTA